ncbi:MAG: AAA family ATPase, partial [Bacteroidales bacterium]|nr:AAA family ATPase [Bacteroidales bacterium]
MQIQQIRVTNFRLLKDFSIDLDKELSLIIGKNNVGKTSLLLVLDKFLGENKNKFKFNDFNLDFQDELQKMMESPIVDEEVFNKCYSLTGITMRIIIKYNDDDDLSKIGNTVLMDLDEEKNFFTLGFDYTIDYESYCKMY